MFKLEIHTLICKYDGFLHTLTETGKNQWENGTDLIKKLVSGIPIEQLADSIDGKLTGSVTCRMLGLHIF